MASVFSTIAYNLQYDEIYEIGQIFQSEMELKVVNWG